MPGVSPASFGALDEGSSLTRRPTLNFVGAGVTATDDSDNNRTTIAIPGSSSGGLSGVFLPETYGAVADGSTDDSTAINAAITAANAAGGGTVWLNPAKTYAISSAVVLKAAVALYGGENYVYGATLKATSTTMNHLTCTSAYGCTIKGIRFDCASLKTAGTAILATSVGRFVVDACMVNNAYDAITVEGANGVWLSRIDVNAPKHNGFTFGVAALTIEVHVTDCYLENSSSTPASTGVGIYWGDACDAGWFSNTDVIGYQIGFQLVGTNTWLSGCAADWCKVCFQYEGNEHTAVDCYCAALTPWNSFYQAGDIGVWFKAGVNYVMWSGRIRRAHTAVQVDSAGLGLGVVNAQIYEQAIGSGTANGIVFGANPTGFVSTGCNITVNTDAWNANGNALPGLVHLNYESP